MLHISDNIELRFSVPQEAMDLADPRSRQYYENRPELKRYIGILLSSAEQMCKDVGRLSEDQWEAVNAADRDAENGVQPTRELEALRSTCRVAILYALGYLYEHRDEADHHQLMLTLRSILFAVREGVF